MAPGFYWAVRKIAKRYTGANPPTVAGLSGNTSSGPSRLLPNAVIDVIDVTVRDNIGRFLLPFNPKK